MIKNRKRLKIFLFFLIGVLTLSIGYASISAINMLINGNGTASVNQNNFKVHFTQAQAITGTTGVSGTSTIDAQDDTKAMFDVTGLTKVGDYAEAVYIVRNDSNGVGAEISLNLSNTNNEYFKVTETILDNKLQAGEETTAKVKVEMIKTPITDSVSTSITATLIASPLEDAEATGGSAASKIAGDPVSFATDSWATIKKAVQDNNTSVYNVGDTKEVTINNVDYTVRIVNKTTGDHCGDNDTGYSQTACGFVVEFAEVVETRAMNSTNTNVGSWPATEMRTYLNGTFFNSLPNDLQSAIKLTRVISGYGNNGTDSGNFTSTDNIYLLSGVEIHGSDDYDTAASTTSQLDYYIGMTGETGDCDWYPGCTTTYYYRAIKQYNSSDYYYWLRSAYSSYGNDFRGVASYGGLSYYAADGSDGDSYGSGHGVAPAFRIG